MITAFVFAVVGVGLAAQSPTPAQSPSSTPSPPSAQSSPAATPSPTQTPSTAASQAAGANQITVTGCLREAAGGPTATTGSAPTAGTDAPNTAASGGKYELANAVPSSSNATSADTKETASKTFRLIANDSALAPHVGKKMEFTGTIENQDKASASASASAEPTLRAVSAKILAPDCKE
jgi:hypothetical protein